MPRHTIAGRTLSYRDVGQGRPLLLLHGFPFTGESFWPQLDAPPPGVRLIVPDHRGFGESAPGPGVATMEALADDALALLDALGVKQAVVGGVSMGGYVAIALLRAAPARVEGLVLLDTQAGADDEAGRARREATAAEVEARGVAPLAEAMLPKLFAPGAPAEAVARVDRLMRAQHPQGVAAASRGMATRTDGKDILPRFAGPALVVCGELDAVTPPDKARALAALLPRARLVLVPGAGHLAHLERPELVNAALAEFLAGPQG